MLGADIAGFDCSGELPVWGFRNVFTTHREDQVVIPEGAGQGHGTPLVQRLVGLTSYEANKPATDRYGKVIAVKFAI